MKASQLTIIKNAIDRLEDLKSEVENVKNELQDEYDNLSIDAQNSDAEVLSAKHHQRKAPGSRSQRVIK